MSTPSQRIVMLMGLTKEARSALATGLRHLGWAIIETDVSAAAAEKKLIQSLQKGKEVVINRSNKSTPERLEWIQFIQETFKDRVQLSWIGVVMDSQTRGSGLQSEIEEKLPAANGQPFSSEGFDKILSLRELQPDPVSFFGPSQQLQKSKHESPDNDHQSNCLDTFQWNAKKHERLLGQGDVVLLFDLNGTLTSHTARRRSTGSNKLRPGVEHLLQLKNRFRLGIFSSATYPTVNKVLSMFGDKLGEHIFDPELIFFRLHTIPVDRRLAQKHGLRPWDTAKPLGQLFSHIHRVVLFDDDHWKAVRGEESNMVTVPCWNEDVPNDTVLEHLMRYTLEFFGDQSEEFDLRTRTSEFSKALWKTVPVEEVESDIVPFTAVAERSRRRDRQRDQW